MFLSELTTEIQININVFFKPVQVHMSEGLSGSQTRTIILYYYEPIKIPN